MKAARGVALVLAVAFVLPAFAAAGAPDVVLDGIRLGQSLARVRPHLGKSLGVHAFEDGWRAEGFQRDGYYVVLETAPNRPDVIVAIQVTGERNSAGRGLGPLDLGDTSSETTVVLGAPESSRDAVDEATGEPVADTRYLDFGNASIEIHAGRIASIKLQTPKPRDADAFPDLPVFLAAIRSGDAQRIARLLSSDLMLSGEPAWSGPMVDELRSDTRIRAALRDLAGLPDAPSGGAIRVWTGDDGVTHSGYVFQFAEGPVGELTFVRGLAGWELQAVD